MEKEYRWITYIRNRPKANKNFLGIITGPTGSGKSWTGMSICFMVDKTFTPERIVTNIKQLMELINSGKIKSGQALLWDEAGIDISSRAWQSLTNKMVNYLLQTFRHKRFILIFTTPYMDFIDSSTRKLFHAEFQTQLIDTKKKTVKIKPFLIQYNARNRKFYYKYLRIITELGLAPVKYWNVPKPPLWLIQEYERKKLEFTKELNIDIERQLKEGGKKPLTPLQEKAKELYEKHGDTEKVAELMGTSVRNVQFHLWKVKNKGYRLDKPLKLP